MLKLDVIWHFTKRIFDVEQGRMYGATSEEETLYLHVNDLARQATITPRQNAHC